jgi:hypothetical protein
MNTPDDDSDAEWWFRQSEKALWRAAWHRRFARRLAALGMC